MIQSINVPPFVPPNYDVNCESKITTMRLLFTVLACLFSVSITAQEQVITYPYNPDADTDSLIAVPDALEFLTIYGNEFIPEPVTVDGIEIIEFFTDSINNIQNQLEQSISSNDSLSQNYL